MMLIYFDRSLREGSFFMVKIEKNKKHNHFVSLGYALVAGILVAGCFVAWNLYKDSKTEIISKKTEAIPTKPIVKVSPTIKTKNEAVEVIVTPPKIKKVILDTRPWAAVADFTLDKSVKAELSGSAIAIKLEQAFGEKYRLVTRRQLKKAIHELRFQNSDLVDKSKVKQFGRMIGTEYLISGSVIQLGSKITIACQIFNVQTGAIRQTAEISTSNVDDLNYIFFREAADILVMSDTEKHEYIDAKINYPKNLKAGKKAFSSKDYDKAIMYFNLALNVKRSDEVENLLIMASTKARAHHLYNERKVKFELAIQDGNKLLADQKWIKAEKVFREARKIPGYEYNNKANNGIRSARGGADVVLRKKQAGKELEAQLDSASLLLENAKKLDKNDIKAYRKCSVAIQMINKFCTSSHYTYVSKQAKQYLARFITGAEAYQRSLNPPLPSDLVIEQESRNVPLSGLASGSRAAQNRQRDWAIKLGLPLEVKTKKTAIKLRLVPPGKFIMGSPFREEKRNNDEKPHHVVLSQPFYCGKFEISQKEWKQVMGKNPSYFKDSGENAPVEQVSWEDCQKFLKKLCIIEKVAPGTYRLPSEEQWEYACRAGTNTAFCYGDNVDSKMANFAGQYPYKALTEISRNKSLTCGSFKANSWGLYDMHGNVWEWCANWYKSYDSNTKPASTRVLRGGSWNIAAKDCRSATRLKYWPEFRFNVLGFRVIRLISQENSLK